MRVKLSVIVIALCTRLIASTAVADEGMWMMHQLGALDQSALQKRGMVLTPSDLWNPATGTGLASATPSLGGCSASFVSSQGLIITNHHCAFGALQINSAPEHDYITDGFLARTRAAELEARGSRVLVFKGYDDVTERVTAVLSPELTAAQRGAALERRKKELVAECESVGMHCQLSTMFSGGKYYLFKQVELRDVRLVYAPPLAIGNYGGEIDNWMWPRHTADFALLRAYVGPDGKPASYAKDNVPFTPDRYLKISLEGVREGDFTMIMGYPGRTFRYRLSNGVAEDTNVGYPNRIKTFGDLIAILEERGKTGKDVEIKVASILKGFNNTYKNNRGMLEGLRKTRLADRKKVEETSLQAWVDANPTRQEKWGDTLPTLTRLVERQNATRERDLLMSITPRLSSLLSSAITVTRVSQGKGKADLDRDAGYQKRDERSLRIKLVTMQRNLDVASERAMLAYLFRRASALPAGQRIGAIDTALAATDAVGEAAISRLLDQLMTTRLADRDTRLAAFEADEATLAAMKDPMLAFAANLVRDIRAFEAEDQAFDGDFVLIGARFMEALKAFRGTELYPDANGTLRFTHATVQGFSPRDAVVYRPFTTLAGVLAKNTGQEPFDCPPSLQLAAKKGSFGHYLDTELGDLPVNFLSTNDITGGNSGSPIMNGKGELIGLAFDGNYDSMTSDYLFDPPLTRTINVDIRYCLWVMDFVDGAHELMREMGVEPLSK